MQISFAIITVSAAALAAWALALRSKASRLGDLLEKAYRELSEAEDTVQDLRRTVGALGNQKDNVTRARKEDLEAARKRERVLVHRCEHLERFHEKLRSLCDEYNLLPPM
jgi:chromosome segregation ATPase